MKFDEQGNRSSRITIPCGTTFLLALHRCMHQDIAFMLKNTPIRILSLALAAAALSTTALAKPKLTIDVIPALAPNAFGSPSWAGWESNAMAALLNNKKSFGDPTQPTYYQASGPSISLSQILVTGFASWLGNANPGTAYGPQFAGEYGNRMHFGLHIMGNGTKFSVAQLSFDCSSSDPDNSLGFSFPAGSYDYSPARIGIIYNPNGTKTFVTGGDPNQLVDEFVTRGSGNAFAVYDDPSFPGATLQEKIDNALRTLPHMQITGSYSLTGIGTGSATVNLRKLNEKG